MIDDVKCDREEEDFDDDQDEAYLIACSFFRGHLSLVHIDMTADSPSAATYGIMQELMQAHPALDQKHVPIFLEALWDSLPE